MLEPHLKANGGVAAPETVVYQGAEGRVSVHAVVSLLLHLGHYLLLNILLVVFKGVFPIPGDCLIRSEQAPNGKSCLLLVLSLAQVHGANQDQGVNK
jgi:hypothetical protein